MMNGEKRAWNGFFDKMQDVANLVLFTKKHPLDEECVATLAQAQKKIFADRKASEAMANACVCLMEGREADCEANLQQLASIAGLDRQVAFAAVLISAIPLLKQAYLDKGLSEALMWDTLVDVKCKLYENHDLTGIWGTGAVGWYIRLYGLKIIKLGRLEFEPIGYKWDTPYRGIQKGDPVMNMHIPSTGPMKIEDVLDSFKQAYKFYGYSSPMPVAAASWLLYPPICDEVFKDGSNLKNFYDLFDVVEQYEDPENHNFWRIFNMDYEEGILDKVPTDNSLRRGLYEFMKPGRNMGIGRCMLLFDGEKVISK